MRWRLGLIGMRSAKPRQTICTEIANQLADLLEQGVAPWRRPWAAGSGMPANASTGAPYRGINILVLMWSQAVNGFTDSRWVTYKQAQAMGGNVRKGEKGTRVVFWKQVERRERDDDGEETSSRGVFARAFTVFNVQQCEGLDLPVVEPGDASLDHRAEALVSNYLASGPRVAYGGDAACYIPALDLVRMPERVSFTGTAEFYSTLFHEIGHSTGHASRLARDLSGLRGSHDYSREELVAELTAAFLCGMAGVSNEDSLANSAAYLKGWASKLREEPDVLVWASSRAQKAVDFIVGADQVAVAA